MLLAIDAGNTTINIGIIGENINDIYTAYFPTRPTDTPDSFAVTIESAFRLNGLAAKAEGAVVCSVVPSVTEALVKAAGRVAERPPIVVCHDNCGLDIKLDSPAQLGADLAATAAGALAQYPAPCLVIDLGTATKISVLAKGRVFLGGIIYPGVGVSMEALGKSAALLTGIAIAAPQSVIGASSVSAMQSGIVYGTAALIDGLAAKIERELGEPCARVATGGLAEKIIGHCDPAPLYDPHLIFKGMRVIYEMNA